MVKVAAQLLAAVSLRGGGFHLNFSNDAVFKGRQAGS